VRCAVSSIPLLGSTDYYGGLALDLVRASGDRGRARRAWKEPQMDNLIARVANAANLSPETARQAVALIADFIQREASEDGVKDLFAKAPEMQAIIASSAATGGEGMGYGLKGLMGIAAGSMGGGGLMALGGELMGLGLSMEQMQTAGREVFAYAREVAGDQTVGEITASIPGLSQFI
jgi:hypothetical protein